MPRKPKWDRIREEWMAEVRSLCDTVKEWCSHRKAWSVHEEEKEIYEERLGRYAVPTLLIRCPAGRLYVEPIGRDVIGAEGRVDIESFPWMHRLLLVRIGGQWVLKTESGINWPQPWNEGTFISLVKEMTSAA